MIVLAIDTSCDETAAAVTLNRSVLANIIWSQASLHAKFGGVVPSLAQRMHQDKIDWVIATGLKRAKSSIKDCDAVAVTVGPGLAIALEVGISKAKALAQKYGKLLIPINHLEGHLFSCLASKNFKVKYPALGLVVSGGNTILVKINNLGSYQVLAQTVDDAIGEALDKGARILGLGYPGGAVLEKIARKGNPNKYQLPLPLKEDKIKNRFSYSGLKTAMFRLSEKEKPLTKKMIENLAASYQKTAFEHLEKVIAYQIEKNNFQNFDFLIGGGVVNNNSLRKMLRNLAKKYSLNLRLPYSKRLYGDNAAMIGVVAYLKFKNGKIPQKTGEVDRLPSLSL